MLKFKKVENIYIVAYLNLKVNARIAGYLTDRSSMHTATPSDASSATVMRRIAGICGTKRGKNSPEIRNPERAGASVLQVSASCGAAIVPWGGSMRFISAILFVKTIPKSGMVPIAYPCTSPAPRKAANGTSAPL